MLDVLFDLASHQHGLLSRRQIRDQGIERHRLLSWVRAGRLEPVHQNVFAIRGAPDTPMRNLMASVLETGHDATASHSTAAALWSLGGYALNPHHLVVNRQSRHHHHLAWAVHQFTGLPSHHRHRIDHVPVTSPALTMLHLAATVSRRRLERAIDNAWSVGILTGQDLVDLDGELAIQGRDGIVALRKATRERGPGWTPPQSNLESRFMELMTAMGRPDFLRQVRLRGERWSARVDFLHEPSRTVVEIQSERYHTALTDVAADTTRRRRLESLGYTVVEVWDHELFQQPDVVVTRVADAIAA